MKNKGGFCIKRKKIILALLAVILIVIAFFIVHRREAIPPAQQDKIIENFIDYLLRFNVSEKNRDSIKQTVSVARVGDKYWSIGIKPWDGGPPAPEYGIYNLAGKMIEHGTLAPDSVDHKNPLKLAYQAYWNLTHIGGNDISSYFSGLSDLYDGAADDLVNAARNGSPAFQQAEYVQLMKPELFPSPGTPVEIGFRCLLVQKMGGTIGEKIIIDEKYSKGLWQIVKVTIQRDTKNNINLGGSAEWETVLIAGQN